jgi:hypothetical protein
MITERTYPARVSTISLFVVAGLTALAACSGSSSNGEEGEQGENAKPGGDGNPVACERKRRPVAEGTLVFSSGLASYDAAYAKAVEVIASDIVDGHFIAGESWAQVWTRDTAYSIDLGAGLLQPEAAKTTIESMTQTVSGHGEVWIQDRAGHFGGWPNLSDSIVGAQGVWSLYLTTGDERLLAWGYDVTVHTLARAEADVYIRSAGLFGGCSTFMESNSGYPPRYQNTKTLLAQTKALSTNLLYYRAYVVAAEMGSLLGKDVTALEAKAAQMKQTINEHLWMDELGYYAYFEDEDGRQERRMEGTGESFAILWGVADAQKTQRILENTPLTDWGIPSLWPQYSAWMDYGGGDANYYHNGMVWPFVQGYWGWASAMAKSVVRFEFELDRLRALSEKTDTFHEFHRPEDGRQDGSRRQLWSAAGYLSMVYHGLFGMSFDPRGVTFAPVVPSRFSEVTLDGIRYRDMTLNVSVIGSGTEIAKFSVDGVDNPEHRIPSELTGTHGIEIVLAECRSQ